MLADQLSAETAWSIFEAADCFQLEELREESLHAILKEPKVALAKRPSSETLLNEVLSSDLLCISHEELLNLLVKWEEVEGCESRINFIEKYVSMENISQEKLRVLKNVVVDDSQFQRLRSLKLACARSEYTNDAIQRILQHFGGFNGGIDQTQSFLSNWVNVLYSRSFSPGHIVQTAYQCGVYSRKLTAGNWFEWRLPHFAVKLQALRFPVSDVPNDEHVLLSCGSDSSELKPVFSSRDHGHISKGQAIKCRCDILVQRFRVEVSQGSFHLGNMKFEGFLQETAD